MFAIEIRPAKRLRLITRAHRDLLSPSISLRALVSATDSASQKIARTSGSLEQLPYEDARAIISCLIHGSSACMNDQSNQIARNPGRSFVISKHNQGTLQASFPCIWISEHGIVKGAIA
jgi:hypothetical protein